MWVNTTIFFCCFAVNIKFVCMRQAKYILRDCCSILLWITWWPAGAAWWLVCFLFVLCCEDQSSFYGAGMVYYQRLVFCPSVDYWVNSRCSQVVGHHTLWTDMWGRHSYTHILFHSMYIVILKLCKHQQMHSSTIYVFFSVISFMFQHFHHPRSLYTNISLKRTAICNLQ